MSESRSTTLSIFAIIAIAAFARLFHFVPNFAPITALAVFGALTIQSKRLSFLVPLSAMVVSDVLLALIHNDMSYAFHDTQVVVYLSFIAIVALSRVNSGRVNIATVAGSTLVGSLIFFVTTNLAVWVFGSMYAHTFSGLLSCYTMALPFFRNSLAADAMYAIVMFSMYSVSRRLAPRLA